MDGRPQGQHLRVAQAVHDGNEAVEFFRHGQRFSTRGRGKGAGGAGGAGGQGGQGGRGAGGQGGRGAGGQGGRGAGGRGEREKGRKGEKEKGSRRRACDPAKPFYSSVTDPKARRAEQARLTAQIRSWQGLLSMCRVTQGQRSRSTPFTRSDEEAEEQRAVDWRGGYGRIMKRPGNSPWRRSSATRPQGPVRPAAGKHMGAVGFPGGKIRAGAKTPRWPWSESCTRNSGLRVDAPLTFAVHEAGPRTWLSSSPLGCCRSTCRGREGQEVRWVHPADLPRTTRHQPADAARLAGRPLPLTAGASPT